MYSETSQPTFRNLFSQKGYMLDVLPKMGFECRPKIADLAETNFLIGDSQPMRNVLGKRI